MSEIGAVQKQKEVKDVSRKLYAEDIIILSEMQMALLRRGKKVSQKELLHNTVKFAASNEESLIKYMEKEDKTRELFEKWIKKKPVDFGKNWLEEIDTTL